MRQRFAIGLFCLTSVAGVCADDVRLQISETKGVARRPAMVTAGIPFAKGALTDVGNLAARVDGKAIPAQFAKTVSWDDGSVRWVLMDLQVGVAPSGTVQVSVSDRGGNPPPSAPVVVADGPDTLRVSTGPMVVTIAKKSPGLLESVVVDGKRRAGGGKGLLVVAEDGSEHLAGAPEDVSVEQAGPMRTVIRLRGSFPGLHHGLLGYTVRLTFCAGARFVKSHVWLENRGATGYFVPRAGKHWTDQSSTNAEWFAFQGMAVNVGLAAGEGTRVRCESVENRGDLRVFQTCRAAASGEKRPSSQPGFTMQDFAYTIRGGGKELASGLRTDGVLRLDGEGRTIVAALRNFWQEYDKAIEADGGGLSYWLWPVGGRWPREPGADEFENTLKALNKNQMYMLPGGVHKGHELLLDLSGRGEAESSAELSSPLFAFAPAEYYATTEATVGMLAPPESRTANKMCNGKLANWNRMARDAGNPSSASSLFAAREYACRVRGYSCVGFGWMDYGDLPLFGHGHAGLHCDWSYIALLEALRFGDPSFLALGRDMARHQIDVDQLWSDREAPAVPSLQRACVATLDGYLMANFHANRLVQLPDPRANWVGGVALYYMLTGEPKALECALRNGAALRQYWSVPRPAAGGLSQLEGWTLWNDVALFKLTGDRSWLRDAMKLFDERLVPLWKKHGPFLFDPPSQLRDQRYAREDVDFCYAVAALCELQDATGDANLLKLLADGCSQPFPAESFYDAPLFLSDLYAYAGWKTRNPALLNQGLALFADGFPGTKNPPVFVAGSANWSVEKAMMLRTGNVLQHAVWKSRLAHE
jgi:hypothetical protein